MLDKRNPCGRHAPHTGSKLRLHLRLSHPVLPCLRTPLQAETMKSGRKLKIAIVLSISILINVFLIWEVFRLREENGLLKKGRLEGQAPHNGGQP
jgi:hypothetical protein